MHCRFCVGDKTGTGCSSAVGQLSTVRCPCHCGCLYDFLAEHSNAGVPHLIQLFLVLRYQFQCMLGQLDLLFTELIQQRLLSFECGNQLMVLLEQNNRHVHISSVLTADHRHPSVHWGNTCCQATAAALEPLQLKVEIRLWPCCTCSVDVPLHVCAGCRLQSASVVCLIASISSDALSSSTLIVLRNLARSEGSPSVLST